jgi:transcription elongation factor Elf1
MLPRRIPKAPKRASRWRSQAHCNFVRSHACSACGSVQAIEVAHVRIGSGAGVGQKPDDWRAVSLCKICHGTQHQIGERSFWKGINVERLIDEFCAASPKRWEIDDIRKSSPREPGLANNRPGVVE